MSTRVSSKLVIGISLLGICTAQQTVVTHLHHLPRMLAGLPACLPACLGISLLLLLRCAVKDSHEPCDVSTGAAMHDICCEG